MISMKAVISKITKRAKNIERWLGEHGKDCKKKQSHLVEGRVERIYWHYGYMMALKDVSRLIHRETGDLN